MPSYLLEYEAENDRCLLMLRPVGNDFDHWVLGDSFLRPLYQVYDMENLRIGIATNAFTLG